MDSTLPVQSWPQALTDWRVLQAFRRAGCPACLRDPPALQAALVSCVSAAVRLKTGFDRLGEITDILAAVNESAYEKAGGPTYTALRTATAAAVKRSLASHTRAHYEYRAEVHLSVLEPLGADADAVRRELCAFLHSLIDEAKSDEAHTRVLEERLAARHRELAPAAASARRRATRAYWAKFAEHWIDDTLFSDSPWPSVESRLARIDSGWWWRRFLPALQSSFRRGQPTEYYLHQQLPILRLLAAQPGQKKVLAGVVDDWREMMGADYFGLGSPVHPSTLAARADKKARAVAAWLDDLAPGYSSVAQTRLAVADALQRRLAELDPQPFAPGEAPSRNFREHVGG